MLGRFLTTQEQLLLGLLAISICLGAVALLVHGRDTPIPEPRQQPQPPGRNAGKPAEDLKPFESVGSVVLDVPPSSPFAEEEGKIRVSAVGAVRDPDVYELDRQARVKDLIKAAGGVVEGADTSDINQAATLIDGSTLTVPTLSKTEKEGRKLVLKRPYPASVLNPPEYTISGWRPAPQMKPRATEAPLTAGKSGKPPANAANEPIDLNEATQEELETLPGIGPVLARQIIDYRAQGKFQCVDDLMGVSGIGTKRLESVRRFVTVRAGTGANSPPKATVGN